MKIVYGVSSTEDGATMYVYESEASAIKSAESLARKNKRDYFVQRINKEPLYRVGLPEVVVTHIGRSP